MQLDAYRDHPLAVEARTLEIAVRTLEITRLASLKLFGMWMSSVFGTSNHKVFRLPLLLNGVFTPGKGPTNCGRSFLNIRLVHEKKTLTF